MDKLDNHPEPINIKPDYKMWQKKLFKLNVGVASVIFILEIAVFLLLLEENRIEQTLDEYILRFLILPTVINFSVVGLEHLLLRLYPDRDRLHNNMIVNSMVTMCCVVAATHYVFSTTLVIFCIPIMTSVIFGDLNIIKRATVLSCVGVVLAILCRYFIRYPEPDSLILPDLTISLVIVLVAGWLAGEISVLMTRQNEKLLKATMDAEEAKQKALDANMAKSSFLANMSHEIRTPINAVLGMNEIILREEKDAQIRGYAMNIQTAGNSLLSIINDVLDISKIESGRIEITCTEYSLSSLINDSCSMVVGRAKAKDLELNLRCDDKLPSVLWGDETHIRQIIINLLTNAVKYTESGTVTMDVSGETTKEGIILKVAVTDTGIGISEENIDSVFDQFTRVDLKHNRNIEGTGLGLSITKKLIELMDGEITVTSTVGKGSTFTVEVPQIITDSTPVGTVSLSFTDPEHYSYKPSFYSPEAHILVVDDIPVNLAIIVNMLKQTGVKVDTAESGAKAIRMAERNPYHIIFMDHMMPEMDGIEAGKRIRELQNSPNKRTPIVMLTANALTGVREQYMKEGFTDYLSKPVKSAELEKMIVKYLPESFVSDAPEKKNEPQPAPEPQPEGTFGTLERLLPGIDIPLALTYCCDSEEMYMELLNDYVSNRRPDKLDKALSEQDWEGYRREAHTMKSSSLTIGLKALSEESAKFEQAAKDGTTDFIRDNHDAFIIRCRENISKIHSFLDTIQK